MFQFRPKRSTLLALGYSWSSILVHITLPIHIPSHFSEIYSWIFFLLFLLAEIHFIAAHWTGYQISRKFIGNLSIWLSVKWSMQKLHGPLCLRWVNISEWEMAFQYLKRVYKKRWRIILLYGLIVMGQGREVLNQKRRDLDLMLRGNSLLCVYQDTEASCPEKLWMALPWKCLWPVWMWPGATWSCWRCSCSRQRCWMTFKAPSNPNYCVIFWPTFPLKNMTKQGHQ